MTEPIVSVRLDPEVLGQLRDLATVQGCTVSDLLRRGVLMALEEPNRMVITWTSGPAVTLLGNTQTVAVNAATVDASATQTPGEGHRTGAGGPDAPGASEGHPERFCGRCGGPNIPWAAPSPLWNQVMRGGDINGDESYDGIVCPACFAILAEERGVAELWRFSAERVHVPLQTVTPSGRVWDERTWLWREPDGSEGHDAAIEAAYNAITDADPWFGTDQDHWRHAGLAVRAAEPILRQAVAEDIARRIEVLEDYEAAEIAREVGRG